MPGKGHKHNVVIPDRVLGGLALNAFRGNPLPGKHNANDPALVCRPLSPAEGDLVPLHLEQPAEHRSHGSRTYNGYFHCCP
jgi:hypothetical protein